MLYEYAVDPEITRREVAELQHLFALFGLDRGRYISKFPERRWLRLAYQAVAGRPEVEKKRIEILLGRAKSDKLFFSYRNYDPNIGWSDNVVAEHTARPFQAIIAEEADPGVAAWVASENVDEGHELFACAPTCRVPRTAAAIAEKLAPIAMAGNRFVLVDPYLDLRNLKGQDHRSTIRELLGLLAANGLENVTLELHWRTHDTRPPESFVVSHASGWCKGILPAGYKLEIYEWSERQGGEDFHDRFFLTDAGGVVVGAGFEVIGAHEQVQIGLLAPADVASHLADLDPANGAFDLVFGPVIVESDQA
ncbi:MULTISPECIES: hypothetical protein [Maricaulis]|uniref:hypothetical protein n=1 Tax=Maricaulis TaxID=74317 RepID=UPI000323EDFF|nr:MULTISPECIES: hypothetical protein [Maricaulis]MAC89604.1 hypothetical protein [Maricaulis sp.]